jgi:anti-sigma factor RsiW
MTERDGTGRPISEDDLQGYVDRLLAPEREEEVARYLDAHADVASRVETYRRGDEALRQLLQPYADEPVPGSLDLARMIEVRRRPTRSLWWQAAAAVVVFGVGGMGGWMLRGSPMMQGGGMTTLEQAAADSFDVYASDHVHPVEFRAADRSQLMAWAAERLQRPVAAPDLANAGYRFMGGRLLATAQGPAVLFMYDDNHGSRLVMVSRAMPNRDHMPMTHHERDTVAGFTWADNGMGYSLVGRMPLDALHPIANEARRQLDKDA